MKKLLIAALLLTGCFSNRFVKVAEEATPKAVLISIPAVITELRLAVSDKGEFSIRQDTVAVTITGSGVFITPAGHVLTCAHLFSVPNEGAIKVTLSNGEEGIAQLIAKDESRDLALIKLEVDKAVPYATIASQRSLKVGQEVLAIGNPLRLPFSVSHGIISALGRGGDKLGIEGATQSDAFINPGNSGGPLFNLSGDLVGINSRMLPPVNAPVFTGLGFSISPQQIKEFLSQFRGLDVACGTGS